MKVPQTHGSVGSLLKASSESTSDMKPASRSKQIEKPFRDRNRDSLSVFNSRFPIAIAIPIPMPMPNTDDFRRRERYNAEYRKHAGSANHGLTDPPDPCFLIRRTGGFSLRTNQSAWGSPFGIGIGIAIGIRYRPLTIDSRLRWRSRSRC